MQLSVAHKITIHSQISKNAFSWVPKLNKMQIVTPLEFIMKIKAIVDKGCGELSLLVQWAGTYQLFII